MLPRQGKIPLPPSAYRTLACAVAAGIMVASVSGCSGGGTQPLTAAPPSTASAAAGRVRFAIRWPERDTSRLVPLAANSVRLTLKRGESTAAERVLPRPEQGGISETSFDDLGPGELSVTAAAYPDATGSGTVLAAATAPVRVLAGDNEPLRLTMVSTIASMEVVPTATSLTVGQSQSFTATAKNAAGEVVLTLPQTVTWSSSDPSVAAVDTLGKVSALAPGVASVSATETESGKRSVASVTVTLDYPSGYQVVELLPVDGASSAAFAINDAGQVAGYASTFALQVPFTREKEQPSLWAGGSGAPLLLGHLPETDQGIAYGTSESGKVVGTVSDVSINSNTGNKKAFLWRVGTGMVELPSRAPNFGIARGVNDQGTIVGNDTSLNRALFWEEPRLPTVFEFPSPPGSLAVASAVNDAGVTAGWANDNGTFRAFIWRRAPTGGGILTEDFGQGAIYAINDSGVAAGSRTTGSSIDIRPTLFRNRQGYDLGLLPNSIYGFAFGMNDDGMVVGACFHAPSPEGGRAFAWYPARIGGTTGDMKDLNDLIPADSGWTLIEARDINNLGQIVGWGRRNGKKRGFLLLPQ